MCEKKKHKNLEAHGETPTPFPSLQRHGPDQYQLICSEQRLLKISIFFTSTEAFTAVRKKKQPRNCVHTIEIASTSNGPAPALLCDLVQRQCLELLEELWNPNEPVRQQYLQSHGQQLVLDVATPPLLKPEETALSICLT